MLEKNYLSVDEVAHIMGISKSYAYKIVRKLNAELDKLGFLTVSGRINRQYFMERTCYGTKQIKQMTAQAGINEQLKEQDQMAWAQQMNAIDAQVREIINTELIYQ